ncbi:MAG: HD domain-containing protein [Desulfobacteraceae bacterium]|nr:HD domain-containing protein [Desulfobacteraceae bacterium]
MAVPMMIRGKVFGVLTASIHRGNIKFSSKDLYYLSFMTEAAAYSIENLALYENICDNLFSTLLAFVKALEARDFYTGRHAERVTIIAKMIARKMGCSSEELEILEVAGRLHDIGKIGIRDSILLKPGSLTDEEFAEIKKHPVIGADIVEQLGFWKREQEIIRSHHERFDGKGYPEGRKGEEIPFLSRVMFVADAYDAMCSHRCYRNGMNEAKIISIISERAGTQFDPDAVRTFLELYSDPAVYETLHKLYLTEDCDQNSTTPNVP